MKNPPLDSSDLSWLAGLARALLREPHGADDLVQDTVAAAMERPIPEHVPPRAWLASVARRLAARRFRSDARRTRRETRAARPEALPSASELAERAEIAELVVATARGLDEPYRRTILLRFLEGLSTAEIARLQGAPVDTVRWRVRRGLALMRESLVQAHRRDWSAWSVLLLPLARSGPGAGITPGTPPASGGQGIAELTGLSGPAGPSGVLLASLTSLASWTLMKLSLLAVAALFGAGLLFVWTSPDEDVAPAPSATEAARLSADSQPAGLPAAVESLPLPEVEAAPLVARTVPDTGLRTLMEPDEIFGQVVDEDGAPIENATVYVLTSQESAPDAETADDMLRQVRTDEEGRFQIDVGVALASPVDHRSAVDLGLAANGFLRRVLPDVLQDLPEDGLHIVLGRGRVLAGRVVDASGRPVPGLELLAHESSSASISHVSPSRMRQRARKAELGDASSRYHQCLERTDARGGILFSGLDGDEVDIRCLDPGWTIERPVRVPLDGSFVEWLAVPRLGVRLTVVDGVTEEPVEEAGATFRVSITFADGKTEDYGQWVGSGAGGVSFVLGPGSFLDLSGQLIRRAEFYGEVSVGEVVVPWRAEALEDPRDVRGVAEVRIVMPVEAVVATAGDARDADKAASASGPGSTSQEEETVARSTLELDVRHPDGNPVAGELLLEWSTRTSGGATRRGEERLVPRAPGLFRAEVAAGATELTVSPSQSSGSLPPWTGTVSTEADGITPVAVTLARGASVTLRRPAQWKGQWYVHASWRAADDEPWQGSWNYGTLEPTLTLHALRAAEWRFQFRELSEVAPDPLEYTVRLAEWDDVTLP